MFFPTPRTWYCAGCHKPHPLSRYAEGTGSGGPWCAASIIRAIADGANEVPHHDGVIAEAGRRARARKVKAEQRAA